MPPVWDCPQNGLQVVGALSDGGELDRAARALTAAAAESPPDQPRLGGTNFGTAGTGWLGERKIAYQIFTTAVQPLLPNCDLNFSASDFAAEIFLAMANVVEPLPDMSATSAPFSRRNPL